MHNAKLLLLLLFFTQYNLTLKPFFGDSKIKKAALEVLSLDDSASPSEIRKAYYKMALKYHPDKNSSAGAEETFKKCKAAYECLTESNACKLFADMYLNETAKKPSTRQKYKAKKDDFSEGSADPIGEEILGMIDRFFQGLLGIELFNILDNEKNIFLRKSDKKVWEKKMVAMLKTIVIAFDALPGFQTASLETRFHVAKKLQEFANQEKSFYRKNEVISSSISEILRKINSYLAELEREALGRRDQIEGSRFEIDLGKKSANLPNVRRLSQIERSQTVQRNRLSDSLFEFSQSLENLTKKLKNQRSHSILPLLPKQRNNELKFNREEAALTWGDEDLRALDIPR